MSPLSSIWSQFYLQILLPIKPTTFVQQSEIVQKAATYYADGCSLKILYKISFSIIKFYYTHKYIVKNVSITIFIVKK